jgi:hypothetical protein
MSLKEHETNNAASIYGLIPTMLIFAGIWTAPFHFIFNMAEVGAIIGIGHMLVFFLTCCAEDIRLDIKDLQEQLFKKTEGDDDYP